MFNKDQAMHLAHDIRRQLHDMYDRVEEESRTLELIEIKRMLDDIEQLTYLISAIKEDYQNL